jgi:acetyltransferase-like isoleucine patch superfamily enzyme
MARAAPSGSRGDACGAEPRTRRAVARAECQNVLFHMHIIPGWLVARRGAVLEIGRNTFVNQGCWISAHERVRIGADCYIGPYCTILDNAYHTMGDVRRLPPSRPVTIGDRVWIAAHVSILPGVTIGDDAVIGIGAVVTKDVPPRTLVAGNPARRVRTI